LGWLAQAIAMFTKVYGGYIKATYRSGHDFKKLANLQLLTPVFTILIIPFYLFLPYVGLFLKNINLLPSTIAMYTRRPIKVKRKFSFEIFKEIIANGFPRFSSSYAISTGIEAIRATIILQQFGQIALGYWSFTWTIFGLIRQIPQSLAAVYAPIITQEYGKTSDYRACLRLCRKPMLYSALVMLVVIPLGIFGALVLIPNILPNYAQVSGILSATIIAMLPLSILDFPWQVMNAMNKPLAMNIFAISDLLIQCIVMIFAVKVGLGIYSVVVGSVAGGGIRMLEVVIFFYIQNGKKCVLEVS
jgi:O-antigen/teichoic acid export membrane protein